MFQSNVGGGDNILFGGGGGGTQFGQAGGFISSPGQDAAQGNKKQGTSQTLRAVTIKQISQAAANAANDDAVIIDGEELKNLTLVARILEVTETSTNLDLQISDGTGQMQAKLYAEADDEESASKRQQCRKGSYVRIHGHLRPMDGKNPLVAFNVRQIVDFNEVTYHLLSCIYQHAHFTKGAGSGNGPVPMSGVKVAGETKTYEAPAQGSGPADPFLQQVLAVFNSAPKEFSSHAVREALGGRHDLHQIRQAMTSLADDGYLYQTIEDHCRSCSV